MGTARRPRASTLRLTYVVGTYPVPTTTFIDREIELLRRLGVGPNLISLRRPDGGLSPQQRDIASEVHYVLPAKVGQLVRTHLGFLLSRPVAYLGTLAYLLSRPHPTWNARLRTLLHFGLGVYVAGLVRDRYPSDHIHAHFVDRAALIALVVGRLLDTPFSATAHARDIYVDPVLLPEKLSRAKFVATCTRYNEAHLRIIAAGDPHPRVRCVYHGLDILEYHPRIEERRPRPLLLAVGQLKEKKGFGDLLEACRLLFDRGLEFDGEIVGEGPLRTSLEARIDALGLRGRVSLLGHRSHAEVIEKYREASIFVLPCVTGSDGDRDGIPNVILEAMAMGLAVVSTRHSGIPEAVEDGLTGLLVPPGDARSLAEALAGLLQNDELRERFGRSGRRRVADAFDAEANVEKLLAEFAA